MAGYKAAGKALGLLLAAAAIAAAAADGDYMNHWKCFTSCTGHCHDEDALDVSKDGIDVSKYAVDVSKDGDLNATAVAGAGGYFSKCKTACLHKCFDNLPALCFRKCVVSTCLCYPPYSKEKMTCMKKCCDKCFHHRPKPPKPPAPKPKPPPKPPAPKPKPPPAPKPKPPPKPTPKPPPAPKKPCPPPKKPCHCPPGQEAVDANSN